MLVRRTLVALAALAFVLAAPAIASAQSRTSAAPVSSSMLWGFAAGMEDGDGDTGLALRLDGIFPIKALSPKLRMSMVGSLGFTRFSDSATTPIGDISASANILKAVPAIRFSIPLSPAFELYGDAGLGLYLAFLSASIPDGFGGTIESDSTEFGMLMRFAVGGTFAINPGFRLGVELGLNPYFGDVDDNTFSALFVANFRF